MLIFVGCSNKTNPPINTKTGWYRLAYTPIPGTYIEVYVSLTASFNPTGWDGTVWTALPNRPDQWDGATNNLHTISASNPINLTNLTAGTTYYYRTARVDEYGNRSDPETEKSFIAGDMQRSSTLVVAASDASTAVKTGADFVCDGTDDQDTYNEAVANLPVKESIRTNTAQGGTSITIILDASASAVDDYYNGKIVSCQGQQRIIFDYVGSTKTARISPNWTLTPVNGDSFSIYSVQGKVVLSEGTFNYNGEGYITSYVSINGQGNGTILKIIDGINTDMAVFNNVDQINGNVDMSIKNLTIDGNRANRVGCNQWGISFNKADNSTISEVIVKNCYYAAIVYNNSFNFTIDRCIIDNNNRGITVALNTNGHIVNNFLSNNIDIQYSSIYIYSSNGFTVNGNTCFGNSSGIFLQSTNNSTVNNNVCYLNQRYGIVINGSDDNIIIGNNCYENSQQANNTYANMIIGSNSDNNDIQSNICRKGSQANKPKYGIRVENVDCNNNLITNNDCYTGGETNGISDAGTNTSLGAGNRNNNGSWSVAPN
jgi:parallel beta-helix repeat protein